MKRLLTSLVALGSFSIASYAQRTADISTVIIAPTQNQVLNCTDSFIIDYLFINNGPDTILMTDTISFLDPEAADNTEGYWFGALTADVLPGDTVYSYRAYTTLANFSLLMNSSNDIIEGPFSDGDYQFFVRFDGFSSADLTDNNAANNTAKVNVKIDCATSIHKFTKTAINVYPNPAKNNITVNFEATASEGTLSIVDAMGRTIITQNVAKNTTAYTLDISNLNTGAYFVEFASGAIRGTTKFNVSK